MNEAQDPEPDYAIPDSRRSAPDSPTLNSLAALCMVIAAMYFAQEILVPLALAILLGFLLVPLVSLLERWKLGRFPSVAFGVLLALSVLGGAGWLVGYQLAGLTEELELQLRSETIRERIVSLKRIFESQNKKVEGVLNTVGRVIQVPTRESRAAGATPKPSEPPAKDADSSPLGLSREDRPLFVRLVEGPPTPLERLRQALTPILHPLGMGGIALVLVIFMLLRREDLRDRCIRVMGTGSISGSTRAINDAAARVSRYLVAQSTINGTYAVIIAIGLFFLGLPSWALWGFLAGALRFLPYIGLWIGAIPPLLLLLVMSDGWTRPLLGMALFGVTDLMAYLVFEPLWFGLRTGVSPFAIMLAALFWTWLWGPVGLLLATPLTVCLVVLAKHVPQLHYIYVLLGDKEPLKLHEQIYQRLLAEGADEAEAILREAAREKGLEEAYDVGLAPALRLARNEREAGHLSSQHYQGLLENVSEILDSLEKNPVVARGEPPAADSSDLPADRPATRHMVCVPAHSGPDELAAAMMAQLCARAGWEVHPLSPDRLIGEMIESLGAGGVELACIVSLHGSGRRQARAIVKRLRNRYPTLAIVMLIWGASDKVSPEASASAEYNAFATSAREALKKIEGQGFAREKPADETPAKPSSRLAASTA